METTTLQLLPVRNNLIGGNPIIDTHAEVIETRRVQSPVITDIKRTPFVEANTKEVTIQHLTNECVVPVFSKDNEITI
ncbi:MAG: DUF3871 family protein, partial [Dysgonomonas sp.]